MLGPLPDDTDSSPTLSPASELLAQINAATSDDDSENADGDDKGYMAYLTHIIPAWAHKVTEVDPDPRVEENQLVYDEELMPVQLSGWYHWAPDWDPGFPPKDKSRFTSNDWALWKSGMHLTVLLP